MKPSLDTEELIRLVRKVFRPRDDDRSQRIAVPDQGLESGVEQLPIDCAVDAEQQRRVVERRVGMQLLAGPEQRLAMCER